MNTNIENTIHNLICIDDVKNGGFVTTGTIIQLKDAIESDTMSFVRDGEVLQYNHGAVRHDMPLDVFIASSIIRGTQLKNRSIDYEVMDEVYATIASGAPTKKQLQNLGKKPDEPLPGHVLTSGGLRRAILLQSDIADIYSRLFAISALKQAEVKPALVELLNSIITPEQSASIAELAAAELAEKEKLEKEAAELAEKLEKERAFLEKYDTGFGTLSMEIDDIDFVPATEKRGAHFMLYIASSPDAVKRELEQTELFESVTIFPKQPRMLQQIAAFCKI